MSSPTPPDGHTAPSAGTWLAVALVLAVAAAGIGIWVLRTPPEVTPVETVPPEGGGSDGGSSPEVGGESPPTGGPASIRERLMNPAGEESRETVLYRGSVSDPIGGMIEGAIIASGPLPSENEVIARSDREGRFEIGLPAGVRPVVRIEAPGYYSQVVELEREPAYPILLFRGGVIRGVVRGPTLDEDRNIVNTPVPGARLEAAGVDGWFHETRSDAEGRYEFTAPPGSLVLTVRSEAYADVRLLDIEAGRDGVVERDILLEPGVQVEVILFGEGSMVSGARVRAITDLGEEGEATTDGVGKATLPGLTPGNGILVITAPGYVAQLYRLVLGENRPLIRKPITLERSTPWSLEVIDAEGNPRPDAEVRIRLDRTDLLTTHAGDHEGLQILGPDREYSITVTAPDAPRTRVGFRIPTDAPPRLRVVLPRGGRFTGTVLDPRGHPVAGAGVLIVPTGPSRAALGPPRVTTTTLEGTFRTELFAPGPYRVQVHHPKIGRRAVETRIRDGEDTPLGELTLEQG